MESRRTFLLLLVLVLLSSEGRHNLVKAATDEYEYDDDYYDNFQSNHPQPKILFSPFWSQKLALFSTTTPSTTTQPASTVPPGTTPPAPTPAPTPAPPPPPPPGTGTRGELDQVFVGYAPFQNSAQETFDLDSPFRRRRPQSPQYQPILIFRQNPGFGMPFFG